MAMFVAVGVLGVFNCRNRALVFAGDVGSITLGFTLMYLMAGTILCTADATILVFVAVYAVDSVFTIVQRLVEGERITTPHRKHLYQRLVVPHGMSQLKVSGLYAGVQLAVNCVYFMLPAYLHWSYVIVVFCVLTAVYFVAKYRINKIYGS